MMSEWDRPPTGTGPAMLDPGSRRSKHLGAVRHERHISSRRWIRSAIGGCVAKILSIGPSFSPSMRDGWESHRWAVALFAECIAVGDAAILRNAAARPGG